MEPQLETTDKKKIVVHPRPPGDLVPSSMTTDSSVVLVFLSLGVLVFYIIRKNAVFVRETHALRRDENLSNAHTTADETRARCCLYFRIYVGIK